jgi:hypothetical protein
MDDARLVVRVRRWRRPVEAGTVVVLLSCSLFISIFVAVGALALLEPAKGSPQAIATMIGVLVVVSGALGALVYHYDHRIQPDGELRIARGRLHYDAKLGAPVDVEVGAVTAIAMTAQVLVVRVHGRRLVIVHAPRVAMPLVELRDRLLAAIGAAAPEKAAAVEAATTRAAKFEDKRVRFVKIAGVLAAIIAVIRIVAMLAEQH